MELKELLGEDLHKQVIEKLDGKHQIAVISDGSYFPKAKWDEVNEKVKETKKQLDERDKQIEELGKKAKGSEELTAEIERLKTENAKTTADAEARYKQARINAAIQLVAVSSKAKDAADLERFIDMTKIEIGTDDQIKGIDDQVTALKTAKAYLFNTDDAPPPAAGGSPLNPAGGAPKGQLAQLQEAHAAAVKAGNTVAAVRAKQQIFELQQQK